MSLSLILVLKFPGISQRDLESNLSYRTEKGQAPISSTVAIILRVKTTTHPITVK